MQAILRPALALAVVFSSAATAFAVSDVLTIGSVAAPAGGTAIVPIYIQDVPGTTLNANTAGNPAIQTVQFKINFSAPEKIAGCAGGTFPDCQVDFEPAAIFSGHKPVKAEVAKSFGSIRVLYQFDRTSDRIAYNLGLPEPGNLVGYLFITLSTPLADGETIALQLDHAATATYFQDTPLGSTFTETYGNGLDLVDGVVTISSSASACDTTPALTNTSIAWTGGRSGCTANGGTCTSGEQIAFRIATSGYVLGCEFVVWNFGDGSVSNSRTPVHAYSTSGTYSVRATITTPSGSVTLAPASLTVGTVAPSCPIPTLNNTYVTWQGQSGCSSSNSNACQSGETINFTVVPVGYSFSQCSTSIIWNFGDGGSGFGTSIPHKFSGTLTDVTVKMTISVGGGTPLEIPSTIKFLGGVIPTPNCTALGPANGVVNTPLLFVGVSDIRPAQFVFKFGDGGGSLTTPSDSALHMYTSPGTYQWSIKMGDCEDAHQITIAAESDQQRRRAKDR